jgi:hypothetical protein
MGSSFTFRGLVPKPAPSGGEEKAPGWRRQQAEAGWKELTGCKRLEAKSPSGQLGLHTLGGTKEFSIDNSLL